MACTVICSSCFAGDDTLSLRAAWSYLFIKLMHDAKHSSTIHKLMNHEIGMKFLCIINNIFIALYKDYLLLFFIKIIILTNKMCTFRNG